MITALVSLVIAQAPLGPILQPATNATFYENFQSVVTQLEKSNFAEAKKRFAALPQKRFNLEWDDANVPAKYKGEFAAARDAWIAAFAENSIEATVTLKKPGDVKISFVASLPAKPGQLPPGAVFFYSPSPSEPRVEAVIALQRGAPPQPIESADVFNEIGFAVMQYWGRESSPYPMEMSHRTDEPNKERHRISTYERLFFRNADRAIQALKLAIDKETPIVPANPHASIDLKRVSVGKVVQGDVKPFAFQVTNTGNAVLMVHARPDCGCVVIDPAISVDPGATTLLKGSIQTAEFVGELHKRIFLSTNDSEQPMLTIPVDVSIRPIYRTLLPAGGVALMGPKGVGVDIFLAIDPSVKLKALSAQTTGLPSKATLSPWSGSLPDPELNEPSKPRQGYRIHVDVAPGMPQGRFGVTALVQTDHPIFDVIRHSFYVQTGIVALPPAVSFGEIKREMRRGSTLLSRPGKPFKILSIKTDTSYVQAQYVATKPGEEYRISVQLTGAQPAGQLNELIHITTNDPAQKSIVIPVYANVK